MCIYQAHNSSCSIWFLNLDGPKHINITPENGKYHPSERLNCSAEANPSANYTWTELSSGYVIFGPILFLNSLISERSYTYECTADNHIGPPLAKNVTFTMFDKPTGWFKANIPSWGNFCCELSLISCLSCLYACMYGCMYVCTHTCMYLFMHALLFINNLTKNGTISGC